MMHRKMKTWLVALGLFSLTACFEEEAHVEILRLTPAAIDLTRVDRIAIVPPHGVGGETWAEQLRSVLETHRGIAVAPPTRLAALLATQDRYGAGYAAGSGEAAALAQVLGVDAVLQADITDVSVDQDYHIDPMGDGTTQYRRTVDLIMLAQLELIDSTGNPLGALNLNASQQAMPAGQARLRGSATYDRSFLHDLFPAVQPMDYVEDGTARMTDAFLAATVPSYQSATVVLYHTNLMRESAQAIEAARRGAWREAVSIYRSALWQLGPSGGHELRSMLHYNLGVALTYEMGAPSEAMAHLTIARSLAWDTRRLALIDAALRDIATADQAQQQAVRSGSWTVP